MHAPINGYRLTPQQKRKRRDYRLARKAQFTRPDPGFSLYEGRTRGKRIKYTYSDEEDVGSDAFSTRRSNRQSGISTPAEPNGPTFTASGRRVKSRHTGAYGEPMVSGQMDASEQQRSEDLDGASNENIALVTNGSPQRSGQLSRVKLKLGSVKHPDEYDSLESMGDGSDVTSSGGEWEEGDDEEPDEPMEDDDNDDIEMSDEDDRGHEELPQSLVVSLRYKSHSIPPGEDRGGNERISRDLSIPLTTISAPDKVQQPHMLHDTTDMIKTAVVKSPQDEERTLLKPAPNAPGTDTTNHITPEHRPFQEL